MKRALRYTPDDNVLIALEDIQPGELLEIDGKDCGIQAHAHIPLGHKIAADEIPAGAAIVKFGHEIGFATEAIRPGDYVHVHNVRDAVGKWTGAKRAYVPPADTELPDSLLLREEPELTGYRRKNGYVGFRNHLLVISTVVCANQPVEELGRKYRDIITISNPTGCVILPNEVERLKSLLLGLARNPNVGAVIFCGLGCEAVEAEWYYDQIKEEKPAAFVRIQSEGSCQSAEKKLEDYARELRGELDKQHREKVSVSDIRLGTKCGGSDWTTAAVANPVIGMVSDIVVKNGGISMQGETTGWFGAEDFFLKHARTEAVADSILKLMNETYQKCESVGRRIEEGNPTPGNIEGGITTLVEKALGNVKKGGSAIVEGTIDIGEYPPRKAGLYLANNPGLDPISLIGLTSSGANVLLYSTGRGSPVGTPVAPSIKITASPTANQIFSAHMDLELTNVTFGSERLEDGARRLFEEVISVCNGELTKAEINGNREVAFPLAVSPL